MICQERPDVVIRSLLQPAPCDENPFGEDEEQDTCVGLHELKKTEYPYKGKFKWLNYLQPHQQTVRAVDWGATAQGLLLPARGLIFSHQPVSKVTLKVIQFTSLPVKLRAYSGSTLIGEAATNGQQSVVHELSLEGNGITSVRISGGGGEAVLIDYCVVGFKSGEDFKLELPKKHLNAILKNAKEGKIKVDSAKARQCCFAGSARIPANQPPGKWDLYLTVQNINNVPDGTPPEEAATIIGGHLLSAPTANVLGCTAIMLMDHVFDVI